MKYLSYEREVPLPYTRMTTSYKSSTIEICLIAGVETLVCCLNHFIIASLNWTLESRIYQQLFPNTTEVNSLTDAVDTSFIQAKVISHILRL